MVYHKPSVELTLGEPGNPGAVALGRAAALFMLVFAGVIVWGATYNFDNPKKPQPPPDPPDGGSGDPAERTRRGLRVVCLPPAASATFLPGVG